MQTITRNGKSDSKKRTTVVMGDFNAKIGESTLHPGCGTYGLGVMNPRGEKLLDWMEDNSLIVVNTCFQNRQKVRYTWISPGDNQKKYD